MDSGKINFAFHHKFPYCRQTSTNQTEYDHFLTCSQTTTIQLRRQGKIKNLLDKWHTLPKLRDGILIGIQSTYTDHQSDDSLTDTTINDNTPSAVTESLESQEDIGWNHLSEEG